MTGNLGTMLARDPVILVVDDQEANIRLVGTVLTQAGFEVVPALGGRQALARATAAVPDLVLLDMLMPDVDGFEVARQLRADAATAHVPIIFLTAATEREHLVHAFEAGAVDYVTKPFVAEELLARVRTHLELKLTRDHLKRIASEREELASLVAHDLKNPLSTIRFSAQLQQRNPEDTARVTKLAGLVLSATDNALSFIHHYLERRAEGELLRNFKQEPVSIDQAVRRVAARFEIQAQAKELTMRFDALEPVSARGDTVAIEHVIENLVSNAIKFSAPGGEIAFASGRGSPGMARVVVMDRGCGVSAEDQRKLFRRFVRLQGQPTGAESSSGLGLALAKQDVAQMSGELWYEDRPGGGARFAVELPLAPEVATVPA